MLKSVTVIRYAAKGNQVREYRYGKLHGTIVFPFLQNVIIYRYGKYIYAKKFGI